VRQPVICANHHVFCSSCMEMWLKKVSQCPTCRVPITAENPCRDIIGAIYLRIGGDIDKCATYRGNAGFKLGFVERYSVFGRYTVAALEAKVQQYERDVDHLKRALERSDQYIEDLESRLRKSENGQLETQEAAENSKGSSDVLRQHQKINMMMRSLSDNERRSICSNPEAECQPFSTNQTLVFMPSADHKEFNRNLTGDPKDEDSESTSSDFLPTTPSSAFRSLTLRSPGIREKKVAFKPVSHLRRLDFEEYASPGKTSTALEKKINSLEKIPKGLYQSEMESSKSDFWGSWESSSLRDLSHPGPSKESLAKGTTSATLISEEPDSLQMSSEASMDAAYLDKISELDSMMHDGESSSSRGSQLSLASSPHIDLNNTLVSEQQTCLGALSVDGGKPVINRENNNQCTDDNKDSDCNVTVAPTGSYEEGFASQMSDGMDGAHTSASADRAGPSQTEEMSFDLLFDRLDEVKTAPSGSLSPVTQHQDQDHVNPSFPSGCTSSKPVNTTRDRSALNGSQPTKRKSHSPFNTSSPTKLSKLM
ncbi:hypothetical protein XENOCAPTIV_005650, partial [Xenoophorus captivus]